MDSRQLLQTAAGELHGPTQQAHPFVPQFVARQGQVCQALVVDESRGQVLAGGGCEPAAPQAARREARKEMMAQPVKNPPASAGDTADAGSIPGSGGIYWRRARQPPPVSFPGEFHGERSLAGYHLWGHKRVRQDLATKQK